MTWRCWVVIPFLSDSIGHCTAQMERSVLRLGTSMTRVGSAALAAGSKCELSVPMSFCQVFYTLGFFRLLHASLCSGVLLASTVLWAPLGVVCWSGILLASAEISMVFPGHVGHHFARVFCLNVAGQVLVWVDVVWPLCVQGLLGNVPSGGLQNLWWILPGNGPCSHWCSFSSGKHLEVVFLWAMVFKGLSGCWSIAQPLLCVFSGELVPSSAGCCFK